MSDAGVAMIGGGFALACAAAGGGLTALGANWLAVRQRKHDLDMRTEQRETERIVREESERRRLRQAHLEPVFLVLDQLERHLAFRMGTIAAENIEIRTTADEAIRANVPPDQAEKLIEETGRGVVEKLLGEFSTVNAPVTLTLSLIVASLRIDDPALQKRFMELRTLVLPLDNLGPAGAQLVSVRQDVIEYAARLEAPK